MNRTSEQGRRPPVEYDLSAFALRVRQIGAYPKLASLIEKAWDLSSILADLEDALRCIQMHELILQGDPASFDVSTSVVTSALFSHAIILYARATETSSNHRRRRFGRKWLRAGDLDVHQEALYLRNDVIAHFGRGAALQDGPVSKEALIWSLIEEPERKMHLQLYAARASTSVDFLRRLRPLVEHLLLHIRGLAKPAFDAVIEEIGKMASADNNLRPALRTCLFDGKAFFPTEQTRARLDAIARFDRIELESAHVLDILRKNSRSGAGGARS